MPKSRLPREVWRGRRKIVWNRDGRECVRCETPIGLMECHIDHIQSGKRGTNELKNLRTLCRRCHVLRADPRHRGMIAKALKDGIIPPNWREFIWDETDLESHIKVESPMIHEHSSLDNGFIGVGKINKVLMEQMNGDEGKVETPLEGVSNRGSQPVADEIGSGKVST